MKIIGREAEKNSLELALKSRQAELVVVYGRRRIGKTFLIREYYKKHIVFEVAGLADGNMNDQLQNFYKSLNEVSSAAYNKTNNWLDAFSHLEQYIDGLHTKRKKVIFIDEFPWMATPRSKFIMAFENFWNSYCTKRQDIIVVICGSAASFMVKKIIKNKKGLHNRITKKIRLLPFALKEANQFLKHKEIKYTVYDVLQIYMAFGGVPHYLNQLQKGLSVAQNIDNLCFEKDGMLRDEFELLFASLFNDSDKHILIIQTLASCQKGITRKELIAKTKLKSGGDFSLKLIELLESGFITEYNYFGNKKQLALYRLSDEYSRFYLKFVQPNKLNSKGTWLRLFSKQSYTSWSGFAFESVCLKHIHQIKTALKIDAIYSTNSSWFNSNAQIDLLIDRDDNIMNLCEMKFYNDQYVLDKKQYLNIKNKVSEFKRETNTKKNIFVALVTTYGLKTNKYSREIVENTINIDSLFKV